MAKQASPVEKPSDGNDSGDLMDRGERAAVTAQLSLNLVGPSESIVEVYLRSSLPAYAGLRSRLCY
jgi:hypothetical protein